MIRASRDENRANARTFGRRVVYSLRRETTSRRVFFVSVCFAFFFVRVRTWVTETFLGTRIDTRGVTTP